MVIDEGGNCPVLAANGALGVLAQLQFAEPHAERVVQQQASHQRLADPDDQLHRFRGLDQPDGARQNPQHAAFGAAWHQARRWWLGEEAAIAGAISRAEDRGLSFESEDRTVNVRFAEQDAGIVGEIAGGEVVGAIDHDVVLANDVERIGCREPRFVQLGPDVRIDVRDAVAGRSEFGTADVLGAMEDLALQVARFHHIEVDESERTDTGGGKV